MGKITLNNISKRYDKKIVLDNINFNIEEGSFFTFLGPSGCGKTTLLRIIAGFVKNESGGVFLGDKDITNIPAESREVGMVFQNYALFPHLNVYDNVAYGLKLKGLKKKEIELTVKKYLDLVNLNGYDKKLVSELSGGEQQRVAVARTLAVEPKVLLLDEPLSNLDAKLRDKMRVEIRELQQKLGITTIFVTHDQVEALTMSDYIGVFNNGKCVQIGTPKDIYNNPVNSFVAKFIGNTNLFSANINCSSAEIDKNIVLNLENDSIGCFISIRPEHISFSKEKPLSKLNVFEGRVASIQFNGSIVEYLIKVGEIEFKTCKINSINDESDINIGDNIFIEIPSKSIRVLKE